MAEVEHFWGTGRRKSAVARVKIQKGSGKLAVNKQTSEAYFCSKTLADYAVQALKLTGLSSEFDIHVNVNGGGKVGQAGAVRHGITRALIAFDSELQPVLKQNGLTTRDSRVKERKKPGQPGARKRFQFSKR